VVSTLEPPRCTATEPRFRTQTRYPFRSVDASVITSAVVERLAFVCDKEGFTLDEMALQEIARSAGGSLRDAINALEQAVTYYGPSPNVEQVREALGISVDARSARTGDGTAPRAWEAASTFRSCTFWPKSFPRIRV